MLVIEPKSASSSNATENDSSRKHDIHKSNPHTHHNNAPKISMGAALAGDITAAIATGFVISPIVAIIDRSIVANASGKTTLMQAVYEGITTNPLQLMRQRSVLAVLAVTLSTYLTANVTETVCVHNDTNAAMPKFVASSAVNVGTNMWKDALLARLYGVGPVKAIPVVTFALFGVRDSLTTASSFTLPPVVSGYLQTANVGIPKAVADYSCQLALPCAVQIVSTPLHLLSLDLYNRPGGDGGGIRGRLSLIKEKYLESSTARMARTLPLFGVGGVLNTHMRHSVSGWVEQHAHIHFPFLRKTTTAREF